MKKTLKRVIIYFIFSALAAACFSSGVYAKKPSNKKTLNVVSRNEILNKYQNNKRVDRIICINYIADSNAILKMYVRDEQEPYGWKLILATDAFVGQRGIGKQREGDLKTPLGDFNVTQAFGIKANPRTELNYIDIDENIYACDEDCEYYNTIIDVSKIKNHKKCYGEHLIDYKPQYNYGLCLDYNKKNVYPRGSAIFIHVKGNKNYTAGCIAVDEQSMITILQNATLKTKVCIYR